jgi:hypothetical protein
MTVNQELERYLFRLDKALSGIPVSEKAEIVTEIKSHILDAMERNPNQSLSAILASIGEPEQVANKYLLEKGLTAKKPPRHPIIKWLVVGFLGTLGLIIAFIIFILWYFLPIYSVNKQTGEIAILGGAIKVHDESITIYDFEDFANRVKNNGILSGSATINLASINTAQILFNSGNFEIVQTTTQPHVSWSCEHVAMGEKVIAQSVVNNLHMDFSQLVDATCVITIPAVKNLSIEGEGGNITLTRLISNSHTLLNNGNIFITPDPARSYIYQTQTMNGKMDNLISATDKMGAITLDAKVEHGNILFK